MTNENDTLRRTARRGVGTIFLTGLAIALVSAAAINTVGLFFMEFGDELCRQRPSGTILSDPSGWRCDLRLQGVALGVGLFGIYSLPYGLIVAWIARRSRIFESFEYQWSGNSVRMGTVTLLLILVTGLAGILLLPIIHFLFFAFNLMLIPVMAIASVGIALLILIDYSRRQAPADKTVW